MATTVITKWLGGMLFDADMAGHHILMDADPKWGGKDSGPRPMPLLLTALAGCSGMDVVSILDKMKLADYSFEIASEAESTTEHPISYHAITINYMFKGENLPQDKIVKAVTISTEKYCGVYAMLKNAANIMVKIYINDSEVS